MSGEDRALQELVRRVISGSSSSAEQMGWAGRWSLVAAGAFVTNYIGPDRTSSQVWCCMSNGEYAGRQSALQNALESAEICRSQDPRRRRLSTVPTNYVEVTLLAPQPWPSVAKQALERRKQRAIHLEVDGRSALYLPSVWDEMASWTADDLVASLAEKALGRPPTTDELARIQLSEVDNYEILPNGTGHSHGFNPTNTGVTPAITALNALKQQVQGGAAPNPLVLDGAALRLRTAGWNKSSDVFEASVCRAAPKPLIVSPPRTHTYNNHLNSISNSMHSRTAWRFPTKPSIASLTAVYGKLQPRPMLAGAGNSPSSNPAAIRSWPSGPVPVAPGFASGFMWPRRGSGLRPATHAGSWYPGDPSALRSSLTSALASATTSGAVGGLGIVAPHAGFQYSGPTAAEAYRRLKPTARVNRVLVLGPDHASTAPGRALLTAFTAWQTPLGSVPVDINAGDLLLKQRPELFAVAQPSADLEEHSVEMQVPWLQLLLGARPWALVPILIGLLSPTQELEIGRALAELCSAGDTAVVVSTDLAHYGPRYGWLPVQPKVGASQTIKQIDEACMQALESGNPQLFRQRVTQTGDTICGYHALSVLLEMLVVLQHNPPKFVAYTQSNQISANQPNSVSYAAAVF
jgi:AmmeMemoRadiSam system protein B